MINELVQAIVKVMSETDSSLNSTVVFDRINGVKYDIMRNGSNETVIDVRVI